MIDNKIVNGLWIGSKLSDIELLTINSFIDKGHIFFLWVYDEIENKLPEGVILKSANEMIPKEKIFSYINKNQYGHGKGSYAGFSDIFRYKLLYENGGWWTDMDVICLKFLDFDTNYVFRSHHEFPVVGNIMKCPKRSMLMKECYDLSVQQINETNTNWNLPIIILNNGIKKYNLQKYITQISNQDKWRYVSKLLVSDVKQNPSWYIIHLLNEEWRRNNIDKFNIPSWSFIGKILKEYNLQQKKSLKKQLLNVKRTLFPNGLFTSIYYLCRRLFLKTFCRFVNCSKIGINY